ncbi:MAG: Na+/H+ antiporter NhaC family protein [Pseudomonadota bacterium]
MMETSVFSIAPIALALAVSVYSRNVIVGLFTGAALGAVLVAQAAPGAVMHVLITDYFVGQVTDSYNAGVLVLLVFIGGFVHLMETSGGGPAFARSVARYASSRAKGQLAAWAGGVALFFSDIGTPLIVGPVFRPLFDRLRLSREKLAFIIDSTASPVAILVPFVGWAVYVMSLIEKELGVFSQQRSALDLFMSAIPFQAYAILAVLIVPWTIALRLDIGAMRGAEAAAREGRHTDETSRTAVDTRSVSSPDQASPSLVLIPLLVLFVTLLTRLVSHGFPFEPIAGTVFRSALSTAYFFAAVILMGLMAATGLRSLADGVGIYLRGMGGIMQILLILVLAWSLGAVSKDLGAPVYVAGLIGDAVQPVLLPLAVFLLCACISFATGSSWGTFALAFPLMLPAAVQVGAEMTLVVAAILSGGLWGDHCSPISDSTILSSSGAGCDQYEHFRTQLPYALFNGALASLFCFSAAYYPEPLLIVGFVAVQVTLLAVVARRFGAAKG